MKKAFTDKPQTIVIDSSIDYVIEKPGNYIFQLITPRTEVNISSTMKAKGDDNIEMEILIHHLAPEIKAQTTLKAVGFDNSKISLKAKILINRGCNKTESFLTERVLLVSPNARALAIPDLEILTDDVRCSHAASVTKIPEEQIFYLTSRGLSRRMAEEMIVDGFLKTVH
jgi:Fe-S cluster assembly scaffold protein SufB